MNAKHARFQLALVVTLAALMALAAWSYREMTSARASVQAAHSNLNRCLDLARDIRKVSLRPTRAALEEHSTTELATRIGQAAGSAKIPQSSILRIDPQPSRRLAESDYKEQATSVELQSVTLRQLITFLHTLVSGRSELDVTTLRLTAPRYGASAASPQNETWLVEITLTYLIFAPKTSG